MSPAFTEDQVRRYSRHIILPGIGGEGQLKLLDSKVLVIGAGGLGSPVAMYLAAAGVGTLGILDFDRVDESNLQRQILHSTPDVGRPKVASAVDRLQAINPTIDIVPYDTILSSSNAMEILEPWDVVVGGTDRPRCSCRATTRRVTGACSPSRRPRARSPRARRAACSACCPASWGASRPRRPSS